MDVVFNENKKFEEVVKVWLKDYLEQLDVWLVGVIICDGQFVVVVVKLVFVKQVIGCLFFVFDGF